MLVDQDVAKEKGWKVGDEVPTTFGKTGETDLVVGGTYEQNQIAGNYLIGLETYDANYSQRLDEVVAMTIKPDADPEAVRSELQATADSSEPEDPRPERVQGRAAQTRSTSCSASSSCCWRWPC